MQTTKPVRVEMIIVSIKTKNTWMNPRVVRPSRVVVSATAAAMVAVPMPATLGRLSRPRLDTLDQAMPNMPPKIASGLKAPPITLAKKARDRGDVAHHQDHDQYRSPPP